MHFCCCFRGVRNDCDDDNSTILRQILTTYGRVRFVWEFFTRCSISYFHCCDLARHGIRGNATVGGRRVVEQHVSCIFMMVTNKILYFTLLTLN